jgi:phytoene dehydrogenase-like protein
VLERSDEAGGAVRTAEVTLPGFRHDLYAANLNLFVGSPFFVEFGDGLVRHGFEAVGAPRPFCSAFPDGKLVGVSTDEAETLASIGRVSASDVEAWRALAARFARISPHVFPVLGVPMPSLAAGRALWNGMRALGKDWPFELVRLAAQSSREFGETHFRSRELHALLASWGMHLDLPPDLPGGALFCFLETFVSAAHGMALGKGGARTMIDAMVGLLRSLGGSVLCDSEVDGIVVEGRRAAGVRLSSGERIAARRAVVANLTPRALYGRLVDESLLPHGFRRAVAGYRYAPGTMMIHLALRDLPPWRAGDEARRYSYVHLGPYLDDMSLAYARAVAGLLPERPTLVVGQPTAVDPSRAPDGKHVLWVQVRMVPGRIRGDAAGEITATDWDEAKDIYAGRVLRQIEEYAPGLRASVLARHVLSPLDLERANPNLVGGDQLGGSMHPAQNFFLRPFAGWSRYRTPLENLYVCGAGTWPGAGVSAGSGHLLGKMLTRRRLVA